MNNTQIGLVGFFDILGYQNLLERNEPEQIAEEVLPILLGLPDKVTKRIEALVYTRATSKEVKQCTSQLIKHLRLLSFSDTILMTLPIDEENENQVRGWMLFLIAASIVQIELFEAGLPARGAIDYGKFFTKDTCFAGRTIVNAYQLSAQIEMSACVLSDSATKELRRIEQNLGKSLDVFVYNYLVPLKGREQHMPVVSIGPNGMNESNVHSLIMKAFWGNGKDISQSVRSKIMNTEQWFEFILSRRKTDDSDTSSSSVATSSTVAGNS